MIRLALDWWSYHNSLLAGRLDHETMIRRGAELGAVGVSLEYFALPAAWRTNPVKLLQLQSEFRLEYTLGFGVPLSMPDAAWRLVGRELNSFWTLARRLRVRTVEARPAFYLPLPSLAPLYGGFSFTGRMQMRWAAKRLAEFCDRAAEANLVVTFANQGVVGIQKLLWLVRRVDRDNLKVALNTGQALAQGEDPYRLVDEFAPLAATVFLQDRVGMGLRTAGRPIGEGQIDFREIFRLLARHRFDGLCAVDVDLPLWNGRKEDKWVEKSFVHLVKLLEEPQWQNEN